MRRPPKMPVQDPLKRDRLKHLIAVAMFFEANGRPVPSPVQTALLKMRSLWRGEQLPACCAPMAKRSGG